MKIPCWHRMRWGEPFEVNMKQQHMINGIQVGQWVNYIEHHQRGACEKCGFVKERKVNP